MDIKNYISSGILEHYVLGLASEEERREVEMYANAYPEIRKELDAIELATEQYAKLHQVQTPAGVEGKFNKKIDELIAKNPSPPSGNTSSGKSGFGGMWLPVALVGALLGTCWFAFSNYKNNQNTEANLVTVQEELNTLQTDCEQINQENESLKESIRILQNPDNQTTRMGGTEKSPDAIASVIWNEEIKKSYLSIQNLPLPPSGKQYQLWAIVDGTPVSMDVFDVILSEDGLQEVPFIDNPAAFAVTLENEGGSATPTLEEMVLIGNVG